MDSSSGETAVSNGRNQKDEKNNIPPCHNHKSPASELHEMKGQCIVYCVDDFSMSSYKASY